MKTIRDITRLFAAITAFACCLSAFFVSAAPADNGAEAGSTDDMQQQPVFVSGRDGYHTYRIPSIVVTAKGTVLAFCEGRKNSKGDSGDIDMLVKRSEDGGRTFLPQQIVWDDDANTCGNPCPVVDRESGAIWLLMTHNLGDDVEKQIYEGSSRGTRTVWVAKSDDDGRTWSKPVDVTATTKKPDWTWYATGPGCGIQLKSGRLVIPCDHMTAGKKEYYSHVIFSDDQGKTWQLGGSAGPETNECEVAELSDGRLMLNMRNYNPAERARAVAVSSDRGETWSKVVHDKVLIEPICQASLRRYGINDANGRETYLLFSNPADKDNRAKMTVRLSRDDGETWSGAKLLHAGPAAYSCLAVLPDGRILCLYECGDKTPYETISLASFTLEQKPAAKQPKDKGKPLGAALNWIPADAAFYVSVLRNREQIETVVDSRALARLGELPIRREFDRVRTDPSLQAAWQIGRARLAEAAPAVEQTEAVLKHPQTQRFLEFLADICSDEIFVYGDRGFVNPFDRETIPNLLIGFKIRDRNLAAEHLGKLELILGLACMTEPAFQGRMARERIDSVSYLTFKLDKRLLSGTKKPLPPPASPEKKEVETPNEKPAGPELIVALGIKDDYLLVSLGPSTDALKQISAVDKSDPGRLIDRPEMRPVARQVGKSLTSIAYCSRGLNESFGVRGPYAETLSKKLNYCLSKSNLDEETKSRLQDGVAQLGEDLKSIMRRPGDMVAFSLMGERDIETFCYNYGEHAWKDGYKPLELLDHVGGRPLLLASFRPGFTVAEYDLCVQRLSDGYDYFEDRVLWKIDADCRKRCRLTVALLRPILRQLDRINREVLIPTLQDGQLVFVLNDDGPALVADTAAAERIGDVFPEYRALFRDVADALKDVRSSDKPHNFNAPAPFVSQCPWPAVLGIPQATGPNMGRVGRVVILTGSASAARRLLDPVPPSLGNMPAEADHARATVSFVDCAALIDRASPAVISAARRIVKLSYTGSNPAAAEEQVVLHVDALLECLKVLRSVACEKYVENGAVVTHTFWELRDVD